MNRDLKEVRNRIKQIAVDCYGYRTAREKFPWHMCLHDYRNRRESCGQKGVIKVRSFRK